MVNKNKITHIMVVYFNNDNLRALTKNQHLLLIQFFLNFV